MKLSFVSVASVLGFTGVALGAFGAHALEAMVSPDRLGTWSTAVDYHLFHTVVILALSGLFKGVQSPWLHRALVAFIAGIVVFSGSLYVLVLTGIGFLGAITPIGGLLFLVGWLCALFASRELTRNE